jgi:hypothetical protein
MSACSIIRAGRQSAYPEPVRRLLLLVATVAIVGLVVYRQRTIDRWERTLGIGDNSSNAAPD